MRSVRSVLLLSDFFISFASSICEGLLVLYYRFSDNQLVVSITVSTVEWPCICCSVYITFSSADKIHFILVNISGIVSLFFVIVLATEQGIRDAEMVAEVEFQEPLAVLLWSLLLQNSQANMASSADHKNLLKWNHQEK